MPKKAVEVGSDVVNRPNLNALLGIDSEIIPDYGWREIVVDTATGQPRQAGSTHPDGRFITELRTHFERSLYAFAVGVMGRAYLTPSLHLPLCDGLQKTPPFRKMRLLPRDHAKTSVVAHCLPPHILIQPKDSNLYFPGIEGCENRILLSGESATRAESNLGVISTAFESNKILRALWPARVWDRPRQQAKKWNNQQIVIPRAQDYPDPSVYAIGVGGAITGSRPTVIIKDDLVSLEAANSDVVMRSAIEWHKASRALMDEFSKDTGLESLEFIIGTRWAVFDLYEFVLSGDEEVPADHTVDVEVRAIVEPDENGDPQPIWPERFNLARVDQLRRDNGSMFYLLYMNAAHDPNLVDFDMTEVRSFDLKGDQILFESDERDEALAKPDESVPPPRVTEPKTMPASAETFSYLFGEGRARYLRMKYG